MFARMKAVWRDPGMWRGVIGSLIAAAILGAAGVIWAIHAVIVSGVAGALERAGGLLRAGWEWFVAPTSIPHWLFFLMLVCIVLLVRTAYRHGAKLARVEGQVWDILYPPPEPEPQPEKLARGFAPTPGQLALLERGRRAGVFQKVPFKYARRDLKRIDRTVSWNDTVLALKELKKAGAVTFVNDRFGNGVNGGLGYKLTRVGDEYMTSRKDRELAAKRI